MADSKPGREMHPNSLANLRPPVKPGDPPLNPEGRNQYTYREDCEKLFAGLAVDGMEAVLQALFLKAASGNDKHIKLILERALPAVSKHEHELPGADVAGLADALAGFAARRRAPSDAGEPDAGSEGGSE